MAADLIEQHHLQCPSRPAECLLGCWKAGLWRARCLQQWVNPLFLLSISVHCVWDRADCSESRAAPRAGLSQSACAVPVWRACAGAYFAALVYVHRFSDLFARRLGCSSVINKESVNPRFHRHCATNKVCSAQVHSRATRLTATTRMQCWTQHECTSYCTVKISIQTDGLFKVLNLRIRFMNL